jgi:cyclic-di-AMP phosphodiesterase PgpH
MARTYRLPPEVVEGIATHHGTTLVTYFYRKALEQAGDAAAVDEAHFRYKGRKPSTKEMAILMLADCTEGASRAAALNNRNLSRADLEDIVHSLVEERVEDGQLDQAALTFAELRIAQESFIETLVGVYHPRIAYPKDSRQRPPSPVPMGAEPLGNGEIPVAVEPADRSGAGEGDEAPVQR